MDKASLSLKADLAVSCIDLEAAAGVPGATWERFQLQLLNNQTRFGIDNKARQIAWSFTAALDAIVDGVIYPDTPHIFVSINQEEASEKIRYANAILEAWHNVPGYPPKPKYRPTMFSLEMENGSRLLSHPCRPPRGKARARIYLDEMAHYRESLARQIYTAALPATTKGDGYIRIGSSPLGAGGLFWEIFTELIRPYSGYASNRRMIPWWHVRYLCHDLKNALLLAPLMETEERVRTFGTQALIEIFDNLFIEDFQQEYECAWVDESVAWIPWSIIQRNQEAFGDGLWFNADGKEAALALIDPLRGAIGKGKIEPALYGGIDIGRSHDLTVFNIVGKTTTGQLPLRTKIVLRQTEYDDQQETFFELIDKLPFVLVLIDRNGIGAQLAENLARRTHQRAQGVDFTNPNKELWAVEARVQAERGNVPLPQDRDLTYDIHRIKKYTTAAKNNVFDAERNASGHADQFWAWALAIWAAKSFVRGGGIVV